MTYRLEFTCPARPAHRAAQNITGSRLRFSLLHGDTRVAAVPTAREARSPTGAGFHYVLMVAMMKDDRVKYRHAVLLQQATQAGINIEWRPLSPLTPTN
jgi:hypothetical protein